MAADNALKKGIAAVSVLLIAAAAAVGVYAYLGDKQTAESYAERLKDYDLVRDGVLDTFDLVQMRKLLVRRSAPFGG